MVWRAPAWYWTPPESAILGQRDNAAERYAEKAAALQDLLGELNDATIALRLVKDLDFGANAGLAFAAGAAAGWCARASLGDEEELGKARRSLRKADRYWRHNTAARELESVGRA